MNISDIFLKLYFNINKPKEHAGFILRLLAFIIDLVITSILNYILIIIFQLDVTIVSEGFNPLLLVTSPISLFVNWLYFSLLESHPYYRATIGKLIFKLKVVDHDEKKISFGKASGRFFAKIISALILGIGFFMIAFTKNKQGLHDIAAGTFVKIKYS